MHSNVQLTTTLHTHSIPISPMIMRYTCSINNLGKNSIVLSCLYHDKLSLIRNHPRLSMPCINSMLIDLSLPQASWKQLSSYLFWRPWLSPPTWEWATLLEANWRSWHRIGCSSQSCSSGPRVSHSGSTPKGRRTSLPWITIHLYFNVWSSKHTSTVVMVTTAIQCLGIHKHPCVDW